MSFKTENIYNGPNFTLRVLILLGLVKKPKWNHNCWLPVTKNYFSIWIPAFITSITSHKLAKWIKTSVSENITLYPDTDTNWNLEFECGCQFPVTSISRRRLDLLSSLVSRVMIKDIVTNVLNFLVTNICAKFVSWRESIFWEKFQQQFSTKVGGKMLDKAIMKTYQPTHLDYVI